MVNFIQMQQFIILFNACFTVYSYFCTRPLFSTRVIYFCSKIGHMIKKWHLKGEKRHTKSGWWSSTIWFRTVSVWYNIIKCYINYILIKNSVPFEEQESTGIRKLVHWFESDTIGLGCKLTDYSPDTNPICRYQVFQQIEPGTWKKKYCSKLDKHLKKNPGSSSATL